MIVVFLILCVVGLVITCWLGPKKHLVHAARAKELPSVRRPRWPMWASTMFFDKDGRRFRRKGVFFAEAFGSSMTPADVHDGDIVGGQSLLGMADADKAALLSPKSIVIVDGEAVVSRCTMRMRVVKDVSGNTVSFYADKSGKEHRSRPLSEVVALIDHKFV